MKIFLSSIGLKEFLIYQNLFPDHRLNILLSFGNLDKTDPQLLNKYRHWIGSLGNDSGTYTLNFSEDEEKRNGITLPAYIKYSLRYNNKFDFIFNFDSDFTENGFEVNLQNQIIMEKNGLKPIPVIHSYDANEINYYIDNNYDTVAIGSSQVKNNLRMLRILVWRLYNAGIKVHIFGTGKLHYIATLPIYSCDSSNFGQAGARGYIYWWNKYKNRKNKTDLIYFKDHPNMKFEVNYYRNYKYRELLANYLGTNFNFDYIDLLGMNSVVMRKVINIHYFHQMEKMITDIQSRSGIYFKDN